MIWTAGVPVDAATPTSRLLATRQTGRSFNILSLDPATGVERSIAVELPYLLPLARLLVDAVESTVGR